MAKSLRKRRKNKKSSGFIPVTLFILVFIICILVIVGLKLTEKISSEIDLALYPLEYSDIVTKYSNEYSVPESVIYAMIKVESDFKEDAVSPVGACGLMQLMPDTFTWLASTLDEYVSEADIFNPDLNIKYGTYYVSTLYSRYNDWDCVYAAYNAGQGNVNKWLSDDRYSKDGVLTDIPFDETSNHVVKLNKTRDKYKELYFLGE